MRGLNFNINIGSYDFICNSGQVICYDCVEFRLSESCKEWFDY